MSLKIECPHCGSQLRLRNHDLLGKRVKCPGCQEAFVTALEEDENDCGDVVEEAPFGSEWDVPMDERAGQEAKNGTSDAEGQFYKLVGSRVSFREYCWETLNPLILFACAVLKLLRISLPDSSDDPPVKCIGPFREMSPELPDSVKADFREMVIDLKECGFHSPVFHVIRDGYHRTTIYWMSFVHESGQSVARLHRRHWTAPGSMTMKRVFPTFITRFDDESFMASTSGKADMLWPETTQMRRDEKAGVNDLWAQHQAELKDIVGQKQITRVRDREELVEALEDYHTAIREFHVRRGVFKEMSEAEQSRAHSAVPQEAVAPAGKESLRHAEALAEIAKVQNKKPGWLNAVLILAVSIMLFLGAGSVLWSWEIALMLSPILFVHELGHFLAMTIFGYRNLKMFFIPFLGAAVSGQNYNVENWKKAVVSLAGPVPGIAIGVVLGIAGLFLQYEWMVSAAMLTLVLNALNLLPVLPLDGGWIVHHLLFSRHYFLDIGFRIVTALLLLVGSALVSDRILVGLGIFMVIGLPTAFRLGRLTHRLRPQLAAFSTDSQTIPNETAVTILDHIDKDFPAASTKLRAQLALNVFESLNSPAAGGLVGDNFTWDRAFCQSRCGRRFPLCVFPRPTRQSERYRQPRRHGAGDALPMRNDPRVEGRRVFTKGKRDHIDRQVCGRAESPAIVY